LSARVRAVLRRSVGSARGENIIRSGPVEIDLNRRLVHKNGELVQLTRTEWMLLQHLAANAGKIMLNGELLSKVWGPEYRDDLQYLRVWVSRLRRKLEESSASPKLIRTFQGIGYLLDPTYGEGMPSGSDGSAAEMDEAAAATPDNDGA
jgi:two-component system KDP operon response regulator KdpE